MISIFLVICTVYLVLSHSKLGESCDASRRFITSWKGKGDLAELDRVILGKYLRSCRPLRYNIGSFDFYQKSGTTRVVGKIVFFTTKLLIMYR
jgi:hypothetical protein